MKRGKGTMKEGKTGERKEKGKQKLMKRGKEER